MNLSEGCSWFGHGLVFFTNGLADVLLVFYLLMKSRLSLVFTQVFLYHQYDFNILIIEPSLKIYEDIHSSPRL